MSSFDLSGFDCKIWGPGFRSLWPSERREQYLLLPEVEVPLSVDGLSWPSVFDTGEGIGLPELERDRIGLSGIKIREEWVGPFAPYWIDLLALRSELAEDQVDPKQSRVVQILRCDREDTCSELASGFEPIGFDVADQGFRSSLSNCGFYPDEQRELRLRFGDAINGFHLFRQWSEAIEYAARSDDLVPEHAPFTAYLLGWETPVISCD